MLRIALSTLGSRKSGTFGAFAAVTLAAVLVVSCGILLESSLRAPVPVERLGAAAVVVQATPTLGGIGNVSVSLPERTRLPARLAAQLATLPGVRLAVADRSFDTQLLDGHRGLLTGADEAPTVGHGWASAALMPFALTSGRAPLRADELVLGAGLARLGDRLQVVTPSGRRGFTVVGLAATREPQSREASVFFRDDVAARLSGTGDRAGLIGIVLEPGADRAAVAGRVRAALGTPGLRVLTGVKRGEAEAPEDALSREDIVAGLTTFALLAAFVAIFVVASTFSLSVQQRHRELALFRAIGSTPRQVRQMVAAEALLVSVAAFAAAVPLGILAARVEQTLFARAGMLPSSLHVTIGPLPFAGGLLAAIVTTQLAAFAAARRGSRIRPTEALRESTDQRRPLSLLRGVAGLAALAGGVAVLLTSGGGRGSSAPAAAMVWMLAVALLGPLLAWPFAWLIGLPMSALSRGPGMLARANTRANLRRVASIAIPMTLAIALVCTLFYGKTILQQQTTDQTERRTTAAYVLQARGATGLPAAVAEAARQVPGVAAASGSFGTSVLVTADGTNLSKLPARAVDAASLGGVLDLGVVSGSLARLHGPALAVGTDEAQSLGWHTGDRVRIWLGDGTPVTLRVAAVFSRPLGFGEILLPRALAARHVTHPLDDTVFVQGSGVDPGKLAAASPAVEVLSRWQYEGRLAADVHEQALAVYVLLGLIAAFCALALINATTMSVAERAREFALLRLVGAGKRHVRTMIRQETLITVAFGLAVGTLVAVPGLAVFSESLTGSAFPSVPLWLYGALVAFYAFLGFAATVVPTRSALRLNPVRAMAARE